MSLVGAKPSDLHVVISVDTSRFEAAMRGLVRSATEMVDWYRSLPIHTRHAIYSAVHPAARHRSRVVTRRKQRNHW